jgi:hypothetical protein
MRIRLAVVLPFLLITSGAIWWGAPQGAAQQPIQCDPQSPRPQPEHPLEMNTVMSDPRTSQFRDPLVKHVIMEKELYDCLENPGTPQERFFIRDVETFIEIIQRVQGGRTTPVEKRVEEIVCDKGNSGAGGEGNFGIECSARDVPLQEGLVTTRCLLDGQRPQPKDPVEMNTVVTARQDTVKTMKVDKEIFLCSPDNQQIFFGDLYLFTEIVEQRAGGAADTIRPTEKKFQAILCLLDGDTGSIVSCHHFIPAGPSPAA